MLLASWPGIFSYDSGWQLTGFVDGNVTGHHPILHTFLLGICRMAGRSLFGSNNAGALLYSLLQMMLLSAMYAYVCYYLKKKAGSRMAADRNLYFPGDSSGKQPDGIVRHQGFSVYRRICRIFGTAF